MDDATSKFIGQGARSSFLTPRGPIVQRIFERYGSGRFSMKEIGQMAVDEGLELKREGNFSAVIQYMLKNPIYAGWFMLKGRRYEGSPAGNQGTLGQGAGASRATADS